MAKKKWGDRKDGIWLKDIPAMNRIMPPLMPNRADNEAHISVDIDIRPIETYLEKLNRGRTEDKYFPHHQRGHWQSFCAAAEDEPVCLQ